MAVPILIPQTGLVEEVAVLEWLRADGEQVAVGEPVVLIETEKATSEVESPAAGTLRIAIPAGPEVIAIESVLGYVD